MYAPFRNLQSGKYLKTLEVRSADGAKWLRSLLPILHFKWPSQKPANFS